MASIDGDIRARFDQEYRAMHRRFTGTLEENLRLYAAWGAPWLLYASESEGVDTPQPDEIIELRPGKVRHLDGPEYGDLHPYDEDMPGTTIESIIKKWKREDA